MQQHGKAISAYQKALELDSTNAVSRNAVPYDCLLTIFAFVLHYTDQVIVKCYRRLWKVIGLAQWL
jgi:hypothetical protein